MSDDGECSTDDEKHSDCRRSRSRCVRRTSLPIYYVVVAVRRSNAAASVPPAAVVAEIDKVAADLAVAVSNVVARVAANIDDFAREGWWIPYALFHIYPAENYYERCILLF